jgi:hypothetical protein
VDLQISVTVSCEPFLYRLGSCRPDRSRDKFFACGASGQFNKAAVGME